MAVERKRGGTVHTSVVTEVPHKETDAIVAESSTPLAVALEQLKEDEAVSVQDVDAKITNASTEMEAASEPMTAEEKKDLEKLTQVVVQAVIQFVLAGRSLKEIRQRRLYRETHLTYEKFCEEVFDISEARASQIITAAEEYDKLEKLVADKTLLPDNERALRAIKKVDDADKVRVLELASKFTAGAHLTGAAIEKAWAQLNGVAATAQTTKKKISFDAAMKAAKTLRDFLQSGGLDEITMKNWGEMTEMIRAISQKATKVE